VIFVCRGQNLRRDWRECETAHRGVHQVVRAAHGRITGQGPGSVSCERDLLFISFYATTDSYTDLQFVLLPPPIAHSPTDHLTGGSYSDHLSRRLPDDGFQYRRPGQAVLVCQRQVVRPDAQTDPGSKGSNSPFPSSSSEPIRRTTPLKRSKKTELVLWPLHD